MSYFSTKRAQQQFSTTDIRQTRSYSSRFEKLKMKKSNIKQSLPYHLEKAAIVIQKFWRLRMSLRRTFYANLIEQLKIEKQANICIIKQKQTLLEGVSKEIQVLQKLNKKIVDHQTKQIKNKMKSIAKDCVGITFRLQKRMLSQKQLSNLVRQKLEAQQRIQMLKKQKQNIRMQLINKTSDNEQIILRQIKQANAHLLKIVREKNSLKHKLKQNQVNGSVATDC